MKSSIQKILLLSIFMLAILFSITFVYAETVKSSSVVVGDNNQALNMQAINTKTNIAIQSWVGKTWILIRDMAQLMSAVTILGPIIILIVFIVKWIRKGPNKKEWFKKKFLKYLIGAIAFFIVGYIIWYVFQYLIPIMYLNFVK
ncbi:MAG: hypothetical protein ACM3KR_08755 [Deltaproteobacteria bacterium]